MKKIIVIVTLALFCFNAYAQCGGAAKAKPAELKLEVKGAETIIIQTNAYSAKSNDILKETLPFVKGVKEYKFDEATSRVAVAYNPKQTKPETIRAAIAKLGFNADDVKANEKAREKLPKECTTPPKGCSKSCGKH